MKSESLKGKPTILNLWFTNCTPCIEEIPILNEIKSEYGDKVNFVAITFEKSEEVKEFLDFKKFDFELLVDSAEYLDQFGMFGYPKTLILDKDFRVVKIAQNIRPSQKEKSDWRKEIRNRITNPLDNLID